MTIECREITGVVTQVLNSPAGAAEFRELMERGASSEEIVRAFMTHCGPAEAELMWKEFSELPRSFVGTFMDAWYLGLGSGQRFELASEPPAKPVEYARNQRVSWRVEHDVNGIRMYVSHVHGRHADWYKPAAASVA